MLSDQKVFFDYFPPELKELLPNLECLLPNMEQATPSTRLTFCYRIAHDKISSSREGVHCTGIHHHLICLHIIVHRITWGHWIIMLISTAGL